MNYKLIKLNEYSGKKASIYCIWFDELKETSFDVFLRENKDIFMNELNDIISRLFSIGNFSGAQESYFKLNEGFPGDGVCAIFDVPGKKLRLYCIRYGSLLVVVGGGGPKNVQKLQQDRKLKDENYYLRNLSTMITKKIKERDLWFTKDGMEFEGNLEFNDEDYE